MDEERDGGKKKGIKRWTEGHDMPREGGVGQLDGWMEERKDRWKEKRMAGGING